MAKPCNNCPFKKNIMPGWLGAKRMQNIIEQDSFVCHKTAYGKDKNKRQCAGHIHINKQKNVFYRTALAFGIKIKIKESDTLFGNVDKCIKHHKR